MTKEARMTNIQMTKAAMGRCFIIIQMTKAAMGRCFIIRGLEIRHSLVIGGSLVVHSTFDYNRCHEVRDRHPRWRPRRAAVVAWRKDAAASCPAAEHGSGGEPRRYRADEQCAEAADAGERR